MKFYSMLAAAMLMIGASSCKKDKTITPDQPPILNQKLLVQTNMGEEAIVISYNADRSVKEFITPLSGNSMIKDVFTYNGGIVTQSHYLNDKQTSEYILTLTNGRLTQSVYNGFNDQGIVNYTVVATHTYNAKGQLVQVQTDNGVKEEYEYDANGNLAVKRTYNSNILKYIAEFEYYANYTEKPMSFNFMEPNGWGAFRPMFSKNMRKRQKITNAVTQQLSNDLVYTYELDNDGYVVKGKYVDLIWSEAHQWTNVYQ